MLKESIKKLDIALKQIAKETIDLKLVRDDKLADYRKGKEKIILIEFENAKKKVKEEALKLSSSKMPKSVVNKIVSLAETLESKDAEQLRRTVDQLILLADELPTETGGISFKIHKRIPEEIEPDVNADLQELEKCFANGCYRSSIILCGRLLEIALHRKYFEATDFDILEKNPGIGLGNLIAKLAEKNVKLDPGLTQQIHLINQMRIFSVHKKKEAFYPSKEQTMAIILYTIDSLNKIFK
ncbi:MAG: hypothetical protein V1837_06965 [Candidatus Woesearchaeota archaeon]